MLLVFTTWKQVKTPQKKKISFYQQDQSRTTYHGDSGWKFSSVASTVSSCSSAGILWETKLLDGPVCNLKVGGATAFSNMFQTNYSKFKANTEMLQFPKWPLGVGFRKEMIDDNQ